MSKTKTLTLMLVIALIMQACISTVIKTEPTPTAPPAASTPLLTTGATPEPPENPAGAIFEVPEYWFYAQLAPTETARPSKGRSNYQP